LTVLPSFILRVQVNAFSPPSGLRVLDRRLHSSAAAARPALSMVQRRDVIVGRGRIGSLLYELGGRSGVLVGRDDPIPADVEGPIYVCTRNDALASIIDKTPASRREDLVFLQNGMLEPFLQSYALQDNTMGLIYFAVAKLGEPPIDGKTDVNPEGLTAVNGKWANDFAALLRNGQLSCKVLEKAVFRASMYEKLIWIAAFMLVGTKYGVTVGEVEQSHRQEVTELIGELKRASEGLGITFQDGMVERLCSYTRSVSHFPTAVKEFEWRNGFFWDLSKQAMDGGRADPCPIHTRLLQQVGAVPQMQR